MNSSVKTTFISALILIALLSGCAPAAPSPVSTTAAGSRAASPVAVTFTASPTLPLAPTVAIPTPAPTEIAPVQPLSAADPSVLALTPTLAPDAWKQLPIIPQQISERARQIYHQGLAAGSRPGSFSKVGDCESSTDWYLSDFDKGLYDLGPYTDLAPVIAQYAGSFERRSLATKPGFTAASLMVSLWSTDKTCEKNESPLACEYRVNRPSIALITIGTNDIHRPEKFEANLRRVIEYSIAQGVLPVLATKADDLEKDGSINATIARLAYEYQLPLWNFWRAVDPLYHHGLQDDGAHLTWSPNDFSDPDNLKRAWPVRNLTALQVLDVVWRGVSK